MSSTEEVPQAGDEMPGASANELTLLWQMSSNANQISYTYTSLLMCMGKLSGRDDEVLVPFVEMRIFGSEPDGSSDGVLFTQTLTLDNAAFMIHDISSDLTHVCRQIRLVAAGEAKPEPARLDATKKFLAEAREYIGRCLSDLEGIQSSR